MRLVLVGNMRGLDNVHLKPWCVMGCVWLETALEVVKIITSSTHTYTHRGYFGVDLTHAPYCAQSTASLTDFTHNAHRVARRLLARLDSRQKRSLIIALTNRSKQNTRLPQRIRHKSTSQSTHRRGPLNEAHCMRSHGFQVPQWSVTSHSVYDVTDTPASVCGLSAYCSRVTCGLLGWHMSPRARDVKISANQCGKLAATRRSHQFLFAERPSMWVGWLFLLQ